MKSKTYTIRGITPLMMHSVRLANPFDPLTKEIKTVTGKSKKTDDDLLEVARLEWIGGLYHDDDAGIYVPGYNIFAAIVGGGKLHRLGSAIQRCALVREDKVPLTFDGPKDPAKLFDNKRFVDMRSVKVSKGKVMRCRPIFRDWEMTFTLLFDESSLQADDLTRVVRDTGTMIGLGDYRPRFGRFDLVSVQ